MKFLQQIIYVFLAGIMLFSRDAGAKSLEVNPVSMEVLRYEPFIAGIKVPYGVKERNSVPSLNVYLEIIAPSGKKVKVTAFLKTARLQNPSYWEVRYAPVETGKYTYKAVGTNNKQFLITRDGAFTSIKNENDGFLRKSPNNDHYLVFNSGKPYFGIGHNVAWTSGGSISLFERYFSDMKKNGCNLSRVWISKWSIPLETGTLGVFDESAAKKIDDLLDAARANNIYFLLCIDTYGSLMPEEGSWGENDWEGNPYNKKNGGPCEGPEDFFKSEKAKEYYMKKLKYIVSRWGYSPNILAFELWNEYNAPAEWVKEMAGYVEEIDPQGHIITTSNGYPWGDIFNEGAVWDLEEVGIITKHIYGGQRITDVVKAAILLSEEYAAKYKKPFLVSEIGIEGSKDDKYYDPDGKGTALHNYLWATSLSGGLGGGMNWWWDTYIRPYKLWPHYKALSLFLDGVDWNARKVKRPGYTQIRGLDREKAERKYSDMAIKPIDRFGWMRSNEYAVLNNGELRGAIPTKYVYGSKRAKYGGEHKYLVDYPSDGKFVITIGKVSEEGNLIVAVDGKEAINRQFTVGPGEGPWQRSMYIKREKIYQCVYNEDIEIDIKKGKHTIVIENSGKDWLSVKKIILTNYIDDSYANARCLGWQVGEDMLFWVQNREFAWKTYLKEKVPGKIKGAYFHVMELDQEKYNIEVWDTRRGKMTSKEEKRPMDGILRVDLPDFSEDIAIKVRRVE